MNRSTDLLACSVEQVTPHFFYVHTTVPAPIVDTIYDQASTYQQRYVETYGFQQRKAPLEYIQSHYSSIFCTMLASSYLNILLYLFCTKN